MESHVIQHIWNNPMSLSKHGMSVFSVVGNKWWRLLGLVATQWERRYSVSETNYSEKNSKFSRQDSNLCPSAHWTTGDSWKLGHISRTQIYDLWPVVLFLQLSPALRNRFTEIWCPPSNARADLVQIIEHNIKPGVVLKSTCQGITLTWFYYKVRNVITTVFSEPSSN